MPRRIAARAMCSVSAVPTAAATAIRWPSSASPLVPRERRFDAPAIRELPLTLECRIIYRRDQDTALMPEELRAGTYGDAPRLPHRLLR